MDEVIRIYLEGWCWVEVIGEESLEHVLVVLAEDRSNVLRFFLVLYIFASLISDSSCIFEASSSDRLPTSGGARFSAGSSIRKNTIDYGSKKIS